jgi:hypothetical protein
VRFVFSSFIVLGAMAEGRHAPSTKALDLTMSLHLAVRIQVVRARGHPRRGTNVRCTMLRFGAGSGPNWVVYVSASFEGRVVSSAPPRPSTAESTGSASTLRRRSAFFLLLPYPFPYPFSPLSLQCVC